MKQSHVFGQRLAADEIMAGELPGGGEDARILAARAVERGPYTHFKRGDLRTLDTVQK